MHHVLTHETPRRIEAQGWTVRRSSRSGATMPSDAGWMGGKPGMATAASVNVAELLDATGKTLATGQGVDEQAAMDALMVEAEKLFTPQPEPASNEQEKQKQQRRNFCEAMLSMARLPAADATSHHRAVIAKAIRPDGWLRKTHNEVNEAINVLREREETVRDIPPDAPAHARRQVLAPIEARAPWLFVFLEEFGL